MKTRLVKTWEKTGLLECVCSEDQDLLSRLLQRQLEEAYGAGADLDDKNFRPLLRVNESTEVVDRFSKGASLVMMRRIYDIIVNDLGIEFALCENVDAPIWHVKEITVNNMASDEALDGEHVKGEMDIHATYCQFLVYDIVNSIFVYTGVSAKNMKAISIMTPLSFSYGEDKTLSVNLTIGYLPQQEL